MVASWVGWAAVLLSAALVLFARRFGVNANLARLLGLPGLHTPWAAPVVYRRLRPAIHAGFVLAFWASPQMSLGHLLLAMAASSYGFAIWLEERDPVARFADRHRHYRKAVRALLPRLRRPAAAAI
jgi:methanethiol S-methyltransferase